MFSHVVRIYSLVVIIYSHVVRIVMDAVIECFIPCCKLFLFLSFWKCVCVFFGLLGEILYICALEIIV